MQGVVLIIIFAVAVPVIVGVGGEMFKRWLRLKEKQLDHAAELAAHQAADQATHIERLEQRVRVLERIATDGGSKLAAEIDELQQSRIQ